MKVFFSLYFQLTLISNLCGSITPKVWPGVVDLHLFQLLELPKGQSRKIVYLLSGHTQDQAVLELVDSLLALDPSKRISALEAISHISFYISPLPQFINIANNDNNDSMPNTTDSPTSSSSCQEVIVISS